MDFCILNIFNDIANKVKPFNDSDYHIIYAFICEVVTSLSAGYGAFKWLANYMNPDAKAEYKTTTRDVIIIIIFGIIMFISPLVIIIWTYPKLFSFWAVVIQTFSYILMYSFIRLIFIFRKLNKLLNEEGL